MLSLLFSGQYLPSLAGTPNRVTICQGTGTTVSCGSDSIIAVADIQLGTELTTTCGLGNTSIGCCYYDSADCLTAYSGTMPQYQCSGKSICSFGDSISAADMSLCGVANYPVTNDYLTMEYYCLLSKSLSIVTALSGTLYEWKQVWIKIRTDVLSVLILVQTACKGYQRVKWFTT